MIAVVLFVEFVGECDDLGDLVGQEYEGAGEDVVFLREGLECEGRYDAEVGAAAADGPEEVGVGGGGAGDLLSGCEDHFDGLKDVYEGV